MLHVSMYHFWSCCYEVVKPIKHASLVQYLYLFLPLDGPSGAELQFKNGKLRDEVRNKLKYGSHQFDTSVSIICCSGFSVTQDMTNYKHDEAISLLFYSWRAAEFLNIVIIMIFITLPPKPKCWTKCDVTDREYVSDLVPHRKWTWVRSKKY